MSAPVGFITFLLVTLAFLGLTLWSGKRANRRVHLPAVLATLVSLGITIYFAEKLGDLYDLESAGAITPIHLFLAKLTVLVYLLPIGTGLATIRGKNVRRLHGRFAWTAVALTVLTAATGTAMIILSDPIEAETPASVPVDREPALEAGEVPQ